MGFIERLTKSLIAVVIVLFSVEFSFSQDYTYDEQVFNYRIRYDADQQIYFTAPYDQLAAHCESNSKLGRLRRRTTSGGLPFYIFSGSTYISPEPGEPMVRCFIDYYLWFDLDTLKVADLYNYGLHSQGRKCPDGYTQTDSLSKIEEGLPCEIDSNNDGRGDVDEKDFLNQATPEEKACAGNPIMLASGTKVQIEQDYQNQTSPLLKVDRVYRYEKRNSEDLSLFGRYWNDPFSSKLQFYSNANDGIVGALIKKPSGVKVYLSRANEEGSWKNYDGTEVNFRKVNNEWVYRTQTLVEIFNEEGQLLSTITPQGQSLTFDYDTNVFSGEKPVKIRSNTGQELHLNYNNLGFVKSITDGNTTIASYEYNQDTLLSKVIYSNNSSRSYEYKDFRNEGALTDLYIDNLLYAHWEYDESGRGVLSEHSGGVDKHTFQYSEDEKSVLVTNPLGKETEYQFTLQNNKYLITQVTGHQSDHCAAASQSNSHTIQGLRSLAKDWNGNTTEFEYNNRGLETKQTEATGTPEERTIQTQWHPTFSLPVKVTELPSENSNSPGTQTVYEYDDEGRLLNTTVTEIEQ
ncbi:DUF6531 domain-containing protein [Marinibactrum halimedae]|uniref:RHS repeat protein n=1 Tax=Marinibactrum halimedae TaxID=1444977 RepID=A0AA37T7W7_9GAMM|nr:DUF6531 domain-containing protein [Marinibactrum halimedae]MCD9460950.1 DUF6531 domain-containing protein [Marinibactrum halimedae]GLS27421.1 hypothetical protein GCM10007877_31400 [Marinibactrum halimedae]